MNKIYKVVWNKARNCYVVASEFAKNHQTGSSRIKAASVAAVMAATMLTIGTGVIYAADVEDTGVKETIVYNNTTDETTKLNDPNLKHYHPGSSVHGHTAECGELTYNTTLTIGDINKVVDKLVDNDTLLYNQGIQKVTMNNGTISLIRNDNSRVTDSIALTGNDGKNGEDTSVTVTVGNKSQTFKTGSVVTAKTDTTGNATGFTINGKTYDIKAGTYKAGENVTIANDGTISAKDTTYSAGDNVKIDDQNKISVDLSKYAESDDVAVVYQDNDKNKSLHSTNAGTVGSSSIALGKEATTGMSSVALGDQTKATGESSTAIGVEAEATALDSIAIGGNAKATGVDSIAIGSDTTATKQYSVAIGDDIHFTGDSATAVGQQAHATGDYSTALGSMTNVDAVWNGQHPGEWRKSGKQSTAIGYGSGSWGDYSTALGAFAKTENQFNSAIGYNSQATAENAIALGAVAKAEGKFATAIGTSSQATAENAVALGGAATANVYGGVALGTSSVADRAAGAGVVGAFAPEGADGLTWKANAGAVSVGSSVEGKKITRQITNVAAGTEDTDAVNVAQLKKVSEAAASASQGWKLKTQNGNASDVKPGATVEFDGDANIQVGNDGNKVSVTLKNQLTGIQSITGAGEGAGSISFADGGIKINNKVTINKDGKITGVAAGAITETSTDAVNGSQLHAVATEAGKHTTLSNGKNTTVESTVKDGQTDYKVNVAGDLTDITSVANGDSKINLNKDSIIISNGNKYFAITNSGIGMSYIGADYSAKSIMLGENGTTISGGLNVAGSKITGVAAGVEKTDAVNVGQLKDYVAANDTHIKSGNYAVGEVTDSTGNKSQGVSMDIVNKEGKVTGTVTITDVAKASDVGDVNNIASDIKNQDGSHTTVVDAVNNLNQKLDNKVGDLNYVEGGKGNYVTNGENTTTSIGKLDQALKDVAATAAKHTKVEGSSNIIVTNTAKEGEAANYKVELKKDIDVDTVKATTVTTGQTVMNNDGLKVGKDVSVTATAVIAGKTSISDEGVKVGDKTYISDKGLNANDQKITNVADGKVEKGSTDAVNGGQLYNETRVAKDGNFVKKSNTAGENLSALDNQVTANTESIYHMNGRISDLDNRVNKVGAGAAALAALHPLDFDPDAKWDFAAGYGNYRGANAAAVGAYYRPNEDTMFSVGGTFGNGENMVNAGISFKLGSGSSHVSTSRVAMAKEIKELRGELEAMKSAMLDANAGKKIDTSKLQLFPDVPQNHWAYEYVAQLAGNGMIEGYPDGNFAGDRPMTRYEFAAILYRAMTKGAVLSDKILSEFSHELEYFTVDTIAKDKAGNPTIQRVRTVKENKNK